MGKRARAAGRGPEFKFPAPIKPLIAWLHMPAIPSFGDGDRQVLRGDWPANPAVVVTASSEKGPGLRE